MRDGVMLLADHSAPLTQFELAHAAGTQSADVAVRISDVDPNGRSHNISDSYLRI
jgi:predicted acyl esterase